MCCTVGLIFHVLDIDNSVGTGAEKVSLYVLCIYRVPDTMWNIMVNPEVMLDSSALKEVMLSQVEETSLAYREQYKAE